MVEGSRGLSRSSHRSSASPSSKEATTLRTSASTSCCVNQLTSGRPSILTLNSSSVSLLPPSGPVHLLFCAAPWTRSRTLVTRGLRAASYSPKARSSCSLSGIPPWGGRRCARAHASTYASPMAREPPAAKAPPWVCAASPRRATRPWKTRESRGVPAWLG